MDLISRGFPAAENHLVQYIYHPDSSRSVQYTLDRGCADTSRSVYSVVNRKYTVNNY